MICAQDGRHNKCNILYDNDLAHCGAPSGRRPFNTWTPSDRPFGALAGGYLNVAPLGAISRRRRSGPVLYIVAAAQDNLLSNVVRSRTLQNGLPFQVARHKCIPLELAQLTFATAPHTSAMFKLAVLSAWPGPCITSFATAPLADSRLLASSGFITLLCPVGVGNMRIQAVKRMRHSTRS